MKALVLTALFGLVLTLGVSSIPTRTCAAGLCAGRCITSQVCVGPCRCIGGQCTSFQAAP